MPLEPEDRALQQAIQESLKARSSDMEAQFGDAPNISGAVKPEQYVPQRISIDDRIKDLALRAATQLPLVCDPYGDTWVFIDPPQKQPEQDEYEYRQYIKRYEAPFTMRRETLEKSSPFFSRVFAPTAQFRTKRRRRLVKTMEEDPNIKYVVDLTPPSEGEEAVYLTTELCCSEGVRLWYHTSKIWKVSKVLVGGEEEHTSATLRKAPVSAPSMTPGQASGGSLSVDTFAVGAHGGSSRAFSACSPGPTTTTHTTLEYSPVRHRSAIERVLSALQGTDPQLDSAPKIWTAFAVAKYLEIKHSELDSYIIRWLRAYPNSFFLEVLPEVSLQIADGLQNYDLARDSFAILVGEEALDNLRRARGSCTGNMRSTYGRKKEELPEHIFTRIEYASKNFLERIDSEFEEFANGLAWLNDLAEFRRLSSYTQPELYDTVQKLKSCLKDYVRGAVYRLLCVDYGSVPGADLPHQVTQDPAPTISRSNVWIDLYLKERLLTRTFWKALISYKVFNGSTNFDIKENWDMNLDITGLSPLEGDTMARGTYRKVRNETLSSLIRTGECCIVYLATGDHCWRSPSEAQFTTTLPIRNRSETETTSIPAIDSRSEPVSAIDVHYGQQSPVKGSSTESASSSYVLRPFQSQQDTTEVTPMSTLGGLLDDEGSHTNRDFAASRSHYALQTLSEVGRTPKSVLPSLRECNNSDDIDEVHDAMRQQQEMSENSMSPSSMKSNLAQSNIPRFGERAILGRPQKHSNKRVLQWPSNTHDSFFDLETFFSQAREYIYLFAQRKLENPDQRAREEPHETGITNTLTCLQDSEWKYLPLWAGGNDDGSGGVYNEEAPTADLGFSTPGPEVHTGATPVPSIRSTSEAEFELVDGQLTDTSTNTSMANNRGFADDMHRNRVYDADSVDMSSNQRDIRSDDFTMVTEADEEEVARQQIEAQERIEAAQEANSYMESWTVGKGKERMVDENYADLFHDDDDDDDDDSIDDGGYDTDRAENADMVEIEQEDEDLVLV